MTATMPTSTPPVNNAKKSSMRGEQRRTKSNRKHTKAADGSGNAESPSGKNGRDARNAVKSTSAKEVGRVRDGQPRRQSPAVAVPSGEDLDAASKYSGSTFHLSPNASSLPRPPFKGKSGNSPPLNGVPMVSTNAPTSVPPPPQPMMYRPAPQYGVPYGAFPGYPSGAYPPVMHTPMGMVPPSGVPAYGGHIGASPMGPIAGFPPMVMNAPPPSNVPHY